MPGSLLFSALKSQICDSWEVGTEFVEGAISCPLNGML